MQVNVQSYTGTRYTICHELPRAGARRTYRKQTVTTPVPVTLNTPKYTAEGGGTVVTCVSLLRPAGAGLWLKHRAFSSVTIHSERARDGALVRREPRFVGGEDDYEPVHTSSVIQHCVMRGEASPPCEGMPKQVVATTTHHQVR